MKTNTVQFKANENTGAVAVLWTSEVCTVGGKVRVTLYRNGNLYANEVAPEEVRSCLMYCERAKKALARTVRILAAV